MMKRLLSTFFLASLCLLANPLTASASPNISGTAAFNVYKGVDCSKSENKDSAVCATNKNGDPLTGNNGLLIHIANIVAFVAGAGAVIALVYGGIKYVTSGGDSNNVSNAKNTVLNALIGLIVIALARALIEFFLKRI